MKYKVGDLYVCYDREFTMNLIVGFHYRIFKVDDDVITLYQEELKNKDLVVIHNSIFDRYFRPAKSDEIPAPKLQLLDGSLIPYAINAEVVKDINNNLCIKSEIFVSDEIKFGDKVKIVVIKDEPGND